MCQRPELKPEDKWVIYVAVAIAVLITFAQFGPEAYRVLVGQ